MAVVVAIYQRKYLSMLIRVHPPTHPCRLVWSSIFNTKFVILGICYSARRRFFASLAVLLVPSLSLGICPCHCCCWWWGMRSRNEGWPRMSARLWHQPETSHPTIRQSVRTRIYSTQGGLSYSGCINWCFSVALLCAAGRMTLFCWNWFYPSVIDRQNHHHQPRVELDGGGGWPVYTSDGLLW